MSCSSNRLILPIGARSSQLSRLQVQEVLTALQQHRPEVDFETHYFISTGDRDLKTSLRTLERTNFFTKEVDDAVLQGKCRLGIHSAKDLPQPLAEGLALFCLTRGLDPSDSLVLRPGETLAALPSEACIATSSLRREEVVKQLRADLRFSDLRGTIEQRLAKLEQGEADGVVIAEAALIRLGLVHLNRIRLPGPTADGQGQLAVVGKQGDCEIEELFSCLDSR